MREKIEGYLRAGYPALQIVSPEEVRVRNELVQISANLKRLDGTPNPRQVVVWSCLDGLSAISADGQKQIIGEADQADPVEALRWAKEQDKKVIILQDFHHFLTDPMVQRAFKDACAAVKQKFTALVIVSAQQSLPAELEKLITIIDFSLPGKETIEGILQALAKNRVELSDEDVNQLTEAASGLTEAEAENAFALSLIQTGGFDSQFILDEKAQAVKRSGILEYYQPDAIMAEVGGLDMLKSWLTRRGKAFSPAAREFGLPQPKGCLLIGIPGCGKSLTAKAAAGLWQKPLLRFDVGQVFGSLVGESEANMRLALKTAEAMAPCVLWVDELEKAFSSRQGSLDGGTSMRVFGGFLTWMQEKTKPVFVFATANDISAIPPELMRKGRFDEIFFIDLPGQVEREEIFRIHLQKRNRQPEDFDVPALARATREWTGAEIEAAVVEALYAAFDDSRELEQGDIEEAVAQVVPLSKTMAERINSLRDWAKGRARLASRPEAEQVTAGREL